jgi:hypothetical protein
MFAVVEFVHKEGSARSLAIVPLLWLEKNDKNCFWPRTTNRIPLADFVKKQTPYKKNWPSYKICKVHHKTSMYLLIDFSSF